MKVVNCTRTDWANFSHDNAQALRSIGVDAVSYCLFAHKFNYTSSSEVATKEKIIAEMKSADVVQIMHSCTFSLNYYIISQTKAKLIVYHTGSVYRNDPVIFNKLFNHIVYKSILALPEFCGLGAKNERYIVGAVNTDFYETKPYELAKPYRVRHYPSSAEVKGTDKIKEMMANVKEVHDFKWDIQTVSMTEQNERVMDSDIYIELFKPTLGGRRYGSFGIQALEAAAMGKIVVTQNLHSGIYSNEYGECKLILPETEIDFIFSLNAMLSLEPATIKQMQEATRQWVVDNHSYKATGERLLNKVLQ